MEEDRMKEIIDDYEKVRTVLQQKPFLAELIYDRLKIWASSPKFYVDYNELYYDIYRYFEENTYLILNLIMNPNRFDDILDILEEEKTFFTKCQFISAEKLKMAKNYQDMPMAIWSVQKIENENENEKLELTFIRNDGKTFFLSLGENDLDYMLTQLIKFREVFEDTEDTEDDNQADKKHK